MLYPTTEVYDFQKLFEILVSAIIRQIELKLEFGK